MMDEKFEQLDRKVISLSDYDAKDLAAILEAYRRRSNTAEGGGIKRKATQGSKQGRSAAESEGEADREMQDHEKFIRINYGPGSPQERIQPILLERALGPDRNLTSPEVIKILERPVERIPTAPPPPNLAFPDVYDQVNDESLQLHPAKRPRIVIPLQLPLLPSQHTAQTNKGGGGSPSSPKGGDSPPSSPPGGGKQGGGSPQHPSPSKGGDDRPLNTPPSPDGGGGSPQRPSLNRGGDDNLPNSPPSLDKRGGSLQCPSPNGGGDDGHPNTPQSPDERGGGSPQHPSPNRGDDSPPDTPPSPDRGGGSPQRPSPNREGDDGPPKSPPSSDGGGGGPPRDDGFAERWNIFIYDVERHFPDMIELVKHPTQYRLSLFLNKVRNDFPPMERFLQLPPDWERQ
ncbi:hypothetical protein R1flu_016515 [Riccia fluitans]|uniref:Uncharacterized protein n=1 Tax=Riccia fluitans TaxID=41844 RepID=A0ABD1YN29_9MARC